MTYRERILAHPAVESISDEREPGDDLVRCHGDGIWIYLRAGWANFEDRANPIHAVHCWNWRTCYSELTRYVRREEVES